MQKKFKITIGDIDPFFYEAGSKEEALQAHTKDMGYETIAEMAEVCGKSEQAYREAVTIEEVISLYDLADAATGTDTDYDKSNDKVQFLIDYADEFFNKILTEEQAAQIVDALNDCEAANIANGEWTNNHFHIVERPLSEVYI